MKKKLLAYKEQMRSAQLRFLHHIGEYIKTYLVEIEALILLYCFLQLYKFIPYINLLVRQWVIYLICLLGVKYLFAIPAKRMMIVIFVLFLLPV